MLTHAPYAANIITEKLLQFIWLHRYFNYKSAYTTEGDAIEVIQTGTLNSNQGPDFLQARIRIRDKIWAGNVELHIKTTDWDRHKHTPDSHYDNVVLHVVWQHTKPVASLTGRTLPVLELQPLVSTLMLQQYQKLMDAPELPGCSSLLPVLSDIGWISWKERLAVERLTRKSAEILSFLSASNNHWEEVFWWLLARNFGLKVNAVFFEAVARSIPVNVLVRHKGQINQLECLLLGQANLLDGEFTGSYEQMLQKEFRYLKHKYSLSTIKGSVAYLRMRPATFPAVRLAQLAMLIHQSHRLFSFVRDANNLHEVTSFFDVTANDYWHYHYTLEATAEYLPKKVGKAWVNNIVINTIVPVLFAYGLHMNEEAIKERAVAWLLQTPKEENSIITYWQQQQIGALNAMDSQALIELKNVYCKEKRCLDCAVGNLLLKNSSV